MAWPLGEKEQELTYSECPARVRRCCPVVVDHSFIVQSNELLKMVAPSGAKEQDVTKLLCPVSVCCSWKVDES
jgi:hypothetical protein